MNSASESNQKVKVKGESENVRRHVARDDRDERPVENENEEPASDSRDRDRDRATETADSADI